MNEDLMARLKQILTEYETEPPLGAIILVAWWKAEHPVLSLNTKALNEDGLRWTKDLLGEKGVEIIQRYPKHQVIALAEAAFRTVEVHNMDEQEAQIRRTFGTPVFRLTERPPGSDFIFRDSRGKIL